MFPNIIELITFSLAKKKKKKINKCISTKTKNNISRLPSSITKTLIKPSNRTTSNLTCINHFSKLTFFSLVSKSLRITKQPDYPFNLMIKTGLQRFEGRLARPFNACSYQSPSPPSPPLRSFLPTARITRAIIAKKKAAAEIRERGEGGREGEFAIHRSRKPRDEDIIVIRGRVFKRGKNAKEDGGGRGREGSTVGRRKRERGREEMGCTCPPAR